MTHVLIAVDESESSVELARIACHLFGPDASYLAVNCAHIHVPYDSLFPTSFGAVYAMPDTVGMATIPIAEVQSLSAHAIDDATEYAHRVATDAGIAQAEAVGALGDPVEVIVEAANKHHVDVIVIGSHARNWLSRLFDPSVAEGVKRNTGVPVLFVKTD